MRELSDWLDGYLEFTQNSEPPQSYHTWVGLSLIASAIQRKAHMQWGFETLFPNLFVVLVGPSGRTRKGVAIGIGKDILSSVANVTLVAEATTREAMIRTMKESTANYSFPGESRIRYHSSISVMSEELAVFLGKQNTQFLANLTDWYDSKDKWSYDTVGRGKDFVQGVCCTLIGGTAPDWFQSMLPQEALGGGFTARIIFIVEDKKGKTVPKHVMTEREKTLRELLIRDLNKINNIAGLFKFDAGGEHAYTTWYAQYDKELNAGRYPVADQKFYTYAERRATHLRKISMILSASRSDSRVVTAADFQRANELLTHAEQNMGRTFGGLGKSKISQEAHKIVEYVQKVGITTRKDILARFYHDLDMNEFKMVEDLIEQMGVAKIRILSNGERVYEAVQEKTDPPPSGGSKKVIQIPSKRVSK